MFCSHCGKEVVDEAYVCPNCGCLVSGKNRHAQNEGNPMAVLGFIFAFFFPILGFIFSAIGAKNAQEKGVSGLKLATWGIRISGILIIGMIILFSSIIVAAIV